MLNEAMDAVVLVKGWKKNANWSFPRGKINKDEKDIDCAAREVYEETGFDIQEAGLVGPEEDAKFIEVTMREQHMRLYVFRGVPMDTYFEPRTRKEISKIQWYKLSELPTLKKIKQQQQGGRGEDLAVNANKFYMVAPFLVPLKKWISQQKKLDAMSANKPKHVLPMPQTAAPYVEEDAGHSEIGDSSPPNDMSRIMAQLRQSGEKPDVSDLPELSQSLERDLDRSTQLKNLLHVPSITSPSHPLIEVPATEQTDSSAKARQVKGNALLSLLRSGGGINSQKANQLPSSSKPPQTPMDQLIGQPQMPSSPRHHTPRLPPMQQTYSPPPSFPFSPAQVRGRDLAQTTQRAVPTSIHPPQLHTHVPSHPKSFQIFPLSQHNLHAPAPYQRTGDPQFAQASKSSSNLLPSIPPASKLPPPKLTSHSSALLDIFKSGNAAKSPLATVSKEQPFTPDRFNSMATEPSASAVSTLTMAGSTQGVHGWKERFPAMPSMAMPPQSTIRCPAVTKPQSPQKEALLNLFRSSSISAAQSSQTPLSSLAPPSAPVELSAQQSPSHSRVTSEVPEAAKQVVSNISSNGRVPIQKRPADFSAPLPPAGLASVSATVTGPLNVPQFDKILKRPSEAKQRINEINGVKHKETASSKPAVPPVTILPRPSSSHRPSETPQTSKHIAPKPEPQERKRNPPSPRIKTEPKASPKPFHPQILQRPVKQESPYQATPPRYESPRPVINNGSAVDRRPSQTQEQKNALLSLFNKTSPVALYPIQTQAPVSPMSVMPSRQASILPSPLDASRFGIGSFNSTIGDGRLSSGRQTPKASPVDKKFLLGFLDEVVKQGR